MAMTKSRRRPPIRRSSRKSWPRRRVPKRFRLPRLRQPPNPFVLSLSKHRPCLRKRRARSEEHTSELQSLMRSSYAVFCLKKKTKQNTSNDNTQLIVYSPTADKQTEPLQLTPNNRPT